MKSILLPIDQSEQMPSALETARLLANLFEGSVEGVALRPAFAEIVAPDPIVAVTIPPADWNETEFCRGVRQTFDGFATAHPAGQGSGARFRWRGGSAIEDSGHPVLMAPPLPPRSFGENVVIHWNASTETARAILFALPILRRAKRVLLLGIEGHIVPGPSAKDALAHLEINGITASEKTVVPRSGRQGEAILAEARAQGADLLIKGAYTQSRLRQMIFGGATSHILSAAELPVFFAH